MDWLSLLLFAACPLMMLFCMKGMFSSKGKNCSSGNSDTSEQSDLKSMQAKMDDLMKQNERLMKDVESMKQSKVD